MSATRAGTRTSSRRTRSPSSRVKKAEPDGPRILTPPEIRPVVTVSGFRRTTPGFKLGPRRIPKPDIIYVGEGRFLFKAEGDRERRVRRGDVLFIYPEEEHTFQATGDGPHVAGYIHNEPIKRQTWASGAYRLEPAPRRVTHTGNDPNMRDLFRKAAEVFHGYVPYRMAILESIVREIWLRLAQYWSGTGEHHMNRRMRKMLGYLRSHLEEPVGRQSLAERFHLTPEHVNYLFKKELGITPSTFITRERMQRAYTILHEEDLSVQEVARRVGFDDQFHFSKTFKKVMGVSPSEVR